MIVAVTGTLGVPAVRLLEQRGHRVRADIQGADAVLHLGSDTPAVIDAALAAGVPTIACPSSAAVYADGGDRWLEYGDPVDPTGMVTALGAEAEMARFTAAGGRGVVLRVATLYGPRSAATRDVLALAGRGVSGFPGPARAYQPLVWEDDAAAALVDALETASLAGTYDVVDDEPLTRSDLAVVLAAAVGRVSVDRPLSAQARSQRVSNRRFRAATGWRPRVPDATVGFGRLRHLIAS